LNVVGATFSTISSVAQLPRVIARTPLISGRTCGTSCRMSHPLAKSVRLALHVDSFDADSVRAHCMLWLLDPFSFLQGCSRSRRDAVCSVIASFVLLVGASVADDAVPAGLCVLLRGSCVALYLLSRCRLCLVLLGVVPFRSAPLRVLRPMPRRGRA
jgi:hypothetical protein